MKNKLRETLKNREESRRVVSWELREASAMLLSTWKSTVSDFSLSAFFPFKEHLKALLRYRAGGSVLRGRLGPKMGRLGKALPSSFYPTHRNGGLDGPKAQWPRSPAKRLWGAFSRQKWKLEAFSLAPRMKANHRGRLKRIHAWKGEQHKYIFQDVVPWDFYFF